ncbi:MAG: ferritin-like domain-containing protein [Oscillospiraceae bacterium]|nr:ferritin-like domain-containing protein [Oscillospiraceae bacterium]
MERSRGRLKPVHEYLESLYDSFNEVFDEVAEILKMHGEQPLASMKDYLAAASVKELDSAELRSPEILKIVLADLELFKQQAMAIRAAADEEDLYDLVAMMEDHIGNYNKTVWFIKSMLK